MSLTVLQNLLLNNLMYLEPVNGPFARMEDFTGRKIRSWINAMDPSSWKDEDPGHPPMTTAEEYAAIVRAVKKDRFLTEMRIMCVYTDLSEEGGACRSALFVSPSGKDAVVVFQGTQLTAGSAQWRDNFYSANLSDSPHQKRALAWYRDIHRQYHLVNKEITVCGHSKGGNKAKYVTILDDTVDHCESFDGEGFSDQFFELYGTRIRQRQHLIHNHIVNYDYVSLLMNDIGTETYYHANNLGSGGFTENHLCNTFLRFDEKGNAHMDIDENGRPAEMKAFDEFCNSYLRSMNTAQRQTALETMSEFLDTVLAVDRTMDVYDITEIFLNFADRETNRDDIAYFLAYLIRYEQARPHVAQLIDSLFTRFDLAALNQYVQTVVSVLNWQKKMLFMTLDFSTLQATAAWIVKHIPGWVLYKLSSDLVKRGIRLSIAQLRQLQAMILMIEGNLRTVLIHDDGSDLNAAV